MTIGCIRSLLISCNRVAWYKDITVLVRCYTWNIIITVQALGKLVGLFDCGMPLNFAMKGLNILAQGNALCNANYPIILLEALKGRNKNG